MKLRKMPYYETDAHGDKVKKMSSKVYAVFVDFSDVLRRLPLFEDRKASDELARKIGRMNELRASGETLPPELPRYVETMPPAIRTKLAQWSILSATRVAGSKPLTDHLDDWKAALLAKGNTTDPPLSPRCRDWFASGWAGKTYPIVLRPLRG
jgi:hypothetical protein